MPYYPPTGDASTSVGPYSLLGNTTGSTAAGASVQYPVLGAPGFALSGGMALAQITGATASFAEFDIQNMTAGVAASTDFVANADNATATTNYGNFGINSSTFTGTGAFNQAGYTYLTSTSGDLAIGTTTANAIHFVVNSGATDAITISSAGAVTILSNLSLGPDAAAPAARTISVPSVVAGTTDTAGANTTWNLSRGTGTGVGGNLTINGAPHSTTGSTQNALSAALTINGDTLTITTGGAINSSGSLSVLNNRIVMSGNQASSTWTTSGISFIRSAGTVTDATAATGTTAAQYVSAFKAPTIAATNTGVIFTNSYNAYFEAPVAGTNVTQTNAWGLGADSAKINGPIQANASLTFTAATAGVVLKQGANGLCGTFVANGTSAVTISNTNVAITDSIIISLNTGGGTIGTSAPIVATITATTGFTTKALALDTSTYNYAIIKNAP